MKRQSRIIRDLVINEMSLSVILKYCFLLSEDFVISWNRHSWTQAHRTRQRRPQVPTSLHLQVLASWCHGPLLLGNVDGVAKAGTCEAQHHQSHRESPSSGSGVTLGTPWCLRPMNGKRPIPPRCSATPTHKLYALWIYFNLVFTIQPWRAWGLLCLEITARWSVNGNSVYDADF